eukprot:evm.model.scf_552.2 EVM.evm.TU.scf_552.2   scf_552:26402-36236(-)
MPRARKCVRRGRGAGHDNPGQRGWDIPSTCFLCILSVLILLEECHVASGVLKTSMLDPDIILAADTCSSPWERGYSPVIKAVGVEEFIWPACWKPDDVFNGCDIALARLEKSVKGVAMPRLPHKETDDGGNKRAVAVGYGLGVPPIEGKQFLKVTTELVLVGNRTCPCGIADKMKEGMICGASYGHEISDGDSGGPAVLRDAMEYKNSTIEQQGSPSFDEVVGIVSFAASCPASGMVVSGVSFTQVRAHLEWIQMQLPWRLPWQQVDGKLIFPLPEPPIMTVQKAIVLLFVTIAAAIWAWWGPRKTATPRPHFGRRDLKTICGRQIDQCLCKSVSVKEAQGFTFSSEGGLDEATLLLEEGAELMAQGTYPEAEEKYRSALGKTEEELELHLRNEGRVEPRFQEENEAIRRHWQQFHETLSCFERSFEQNGRGNGPREATGPEDRNTPAARGRKLTAKHLGVAECLDSVGCARRCQGDYKEAAKHHTRALEIREVQLGKDHACLTSSLGNLAEALRLDRQWNEAERCYRRQLGITKEALGDGHPDCAACLNRLGEVLEEQQRMEEAEEVYDKALGIYNIDSHRLESAVTMCNLALVCRKLAKVPGANAKDKLEKAERMEREAEKIRDEWVPGSWWRQIEEVASRLRLDWFISVFVSVHQ